MFKTLYNLDSTHKCFSNVGNIDEPHYVVVGDEVKIDAIRDNREFIESWRESTDLAVLLQRYEAGDVSALNHSTPMFLDVSDCPNNLADWIRIQEEGSFIWQCLDPAVKDLFDNKEEFFKLVGTDEFNSKLDSLNVKESEVVYHDVEEKSE